MVQRSSLSWKKKVISIGLVIVFAISLLCSTYFSPVQSNMPREVTSTPTSPTPLMINALTPIYEVRTPIAYDLEGQSLSVYGDLTTLPQEDQLLQFRQDFTGTDAGVTYVVFTLSTAGVSLNENTSLTLNWEAHGSANTMGYTVETRVTVYLEFQASTWVAIHQLSSTEELIRMTNGWQEYGIPDPFSDYIVADQVRLKFEITHQLTSPQTWTQRLTVRWVFLEVSENVAMNGINASRVTPISAGVQVSGNASQLPIMDDDCYVIERVTNPAGEIGNLAFTVEYDLGYYGTEALIAIRLGHYDWVEIRDATSWFIMGRIYMVGESANMFLGYLRQAMSSPVTPDIRHAVFPLLGDWAVNQTITLLFNISYDVTGPATVVVNLDWARLQIVRGPNPIVITELLNTTIYAEQTAWINVTCYEGKAPVADLQLMPWGESIGSTSGNYLYSRYMSAAGVISITLVAIDTDGNAFSFAVGNLTVLPRPITISLYLSEAPETQEFLIQLTMRDILTNNPLSLNPFTKTILKNGSWFRQQNHQTAPGGAFSIYEPVIDYLDWNYTVTISTAETPIYAATQVRASIILSDCTPFLYINDVYCQDPLKASNPVTVEYAVDCYAQLNQLWLCKNFTTFQPMPTTLGTFNYTFQDVAGVWDYYLYANNSRGYEGYSPLFHLNITPLETRIELQSSLSMNEHSIVLEINVWDELNRSCAGVPVQLSVFDFSGVFYVQEIVTGVTGAFLIIHFDPYLDHSFTIQIVAQSTAIYEGALLTEGGLSYSGYPLYTVIAVGVAVGIAAVVLSIIKRRFCFRND